MSDYYRMCRSQDRIFEGQCRGGPADGQFMRQPISVHRIARQGVWGRYLYTAIHGGSWIWLEDEDQKVMGGLLE